MYCNLLSSCRRVNAVRSIQLLLMKRQEKCIFQLSNRKVHIQFIEAKDPNFIIDIDAPIGKTVLDVALDHNIDIEGACGGINLSVTIQTISAHLSSLF